MTIHSVARSTCESLHGQTYQNTDLGCSTSHHYAEVALAVFSSRVLMFLLGFWRQTSPSIRCTNRKVFFSAKTNERIKSQKNHSPLSVCAVGRRERIHCTLRTGILMKKNPFFRPTIHSAAVRNISCGGADDLLCV